MSETTLKNAANQNTKPTKKRGRKPKSKGLGDTIDKITEATGIKSFVKWIAGEDCGCEERKELLNKLFPYKKPKCLTEQEYTYLKAFRRPVNKIEVEGQRFLAKTHARVFGHQYFLPTCNCEAAFNQMIGWYDELREIAKTYEHEK